MIGKFKENPIQFEQIEALTKQIKKSEQEGLTPQEAADYVTMEESGSRYSPNKEKIKELKQKKGKKVNK